MLVAFRGWNDGGEAASATAEYLRLRWEASRFGRIDPEDFYDFQALRPSVQLVDGVTRKIDWPSNEFHHARVEGRDVVLFIGIEPNLHWRTFCDLILGVSRELKVEQMVTMGAFLADVAHSRDVPIVGSAADTGLAQRLGLSPSQYEGPTGIVGVLQDAAARSGLLSISFWAGVPHYIPAGFNPKAALALTSRVCSFLGVGVDTEELETAARSWEETVQEQVGKNDSLAYHVSRLEQGEPGSFNVVERFDGEDLAAEIERYLDENGSGAGGP